MYYSPLPLALPTAPISGEVMTVGSAAMANLAFNVSANGVI
jgi:hypothetical protein